MSAIGVCGSDIAASYERLRRCALGERLDEPGLVLLMRRGLRGWIEARRGDATKIGPATPTLGARDTAQAEMRDELAQLMATMLLGTLRKEARS